MFPFCFSFFAIHYLSVFLPIFFRKWTFNFLFLRPPFKKTLKDGHRRIQKNMKMKFSYGLFLRGPLSLFFSKMGKKQVSGGPFSHSKFPTKIYWISNNTVSCMANHFLGQGVRQNLEKCFFPSCVLCFWLSLTSVGNQRCIIKPSFNTENSDAKKPRNYFKNTWW